MTNNVVKFPSRQHPKRQVYTAAEFMAAVEEMWPEERATFATRIQRMADGVSSPAQAAALRRLADYASPPTDFPQ
jgi:flagellar biosynthesis regulator FlbT